MLCPEVFEVRRLVSMHHFTTVRCKHTLAHHLDLARTSQKVRIRERTREEAGPEILQPVPIPVSH